VDLALTGEDLRIEAYAGAGKTSTLAAMARELPGRGMYLAFNKAIAMEARSAFPRAVDCRTAHSLAYRAGGYAYKNQLGMRIPGSQVAQVMGLQDDDILTAASQGGFLLDWMRVFTFSDDEQPELRHAPTRSYLKVLPDEESRLGYAELLLDSARLMWRKMADPDDDTIPATHDTYLKGWALFGPRIEADYILFDEAQDANPIMLQIVGGQNAQRIYVGDRFQQIYSWRGAKNAMQEIETASRCVLSQSFRFGQPVADVAMRILKDHAGHEVRIKGTPGIESRIGRVDKADTVLCRTNGKLLEYIGPHMEQGDVVAVTGGTTEVVNLVKGLKQLRFGHRSFHPELASFASWDDVMEYASSEVGRDLSVAVGLITRMKWSDLDDLLRRLEACDDEDPRHPADIVVSTAHKAKGRQWDSVKLADDFKSPGDKNWHPEEANLLYVAATRAKHELDLTDCPAAMWSPELPTSGKPD